MRSIFANLTPSRGQTTDSTSSSAGALSKVAIDNEGKMKVTHMLRVTGSGDEYAGELATHPLATGGGGGGEFQQQQQQYAPVQQRLVVAQFALLSKFNEDDEDDSGGDGGDGGGGGLGTVLSDEQEF